MAVPKSKVSKQRRDKRRANWKLAAPAVTTCPKCGAYRLPHRLCKACMTYGDKVFGPGSCTAGELIGKKKEGEAPLLFFSFSRLARRGPPRREAGTMSRTKIQSVAPGTPAHQAGVRPGETLLAINGHPIVDVLDYKYYAYDPELVLQLRSEAGERTVELSKDVGRTWG